MLEFVEEDPGQRKSIRAKALRRAKVRAHAAVYGNAGRERIIDGPYSTTISRLSPSETHSLSYYHGRTAKQFSGYNDYIFWTQLAPQLAQSYPTIAHDLIAVGAYHEALEMQDRTLQQFALAQGRKSVAWINEHYNSISLSALIGHALIQSQLSRFIGRRAHRQTLKTQQTLIALPGRESLNLRELVRRQQNRQCHLLDPVPLLRQAIFAPPILLDDHSVPMRNLEDARALLEPVVQTLALQAQEGRNLDYNLLEQWYRSFGQIRPTCDAIAWRVLYAAAGMALLEIERLNESYGNTSYLFANNKTRRLNNKRLLSSHLPRDDFEVVAAVSDAFEAALDANATTEKTANAQYYKFGIDNSLRELVGQAGLGCRHRGQRRRLMQLVDRARDSGGREAYDLLAQVLECVQALEEEELTHSEDPLSGSVTCGDLIPREKRVKLHGLAFGVTPGRLRIDFVRWPWCYTDSPDDDKGRLESAWIGSEDPTDPVSTTADGFCEHIDVPHGNEELAWYAGPGYVSYPSGERSPDGSDAMETIRPREYFFNLPNI
jgi:hypothetical protein